MTLTILNKFPANFSNRITSLYTNRGIKSATDSAICSMAHLLLLLLLLWLLQSMEIN